MSFVWFMHTFLFWVYAPVYFIWVYTPVRSIWVYAPVRFIWVYAPFFILFGSTHPHLSSGFYVPARFILFYFSFKFMHPYISIVGLRTPNFFLRTVHRYHTPFGCMHKLASRTCNPLSGNIYPKILLVVTISLHLGQRTRIFYLGLSSTFLVHRCHSLDYTPVNLWFGPFFMLRLSAYALRFGIYIHKPFVQDHSCPLYFLLIARQPAHLFSCLRGLLYVLFI